MPNTPSGTNKSTSRSTRMMMKVALYWMLSCLRSKGQSYYGALGSSGNPKSGMVLGLIDGVGAIKRHHGIDMLTLTV